MLRLELGASPQAATRVRCRRPICPADRHRRARPASGCDAGAGYPGHQGQTEGVIRMARALRFGSTLSFIALASLTAGCAAPQSHVLTAGFGGKAQRTGRSRYARLGRSQLAATCQPRSSSPSRRCFLHRLLGELDRGWHVVRVESGQGARSETDLSVGLSAKSGGADMALRCRAAGGQ